MAVEVSKEFRWNMAQCFKTPGYATDSQLPEIHSKRLNKLLEVDEVNSRDAKKVFSHSLTSMSKAEKNRFEVE